MIVLPPHDRSGGSDVTVVRLAALALMQAHIVAGELHDIIFPVLPPMRRPHASCLLRRFERGTILKEGALPAVETFNASQHQATSI